MTFDEEMRAAAERVYPGRNSGPVARRRIFCEGARAALKSELMREVREALEGEKFFREKGCDLPYSDYVGLSDRTYEATCAALTALERAGEGE